MRVLVAGMVAIGLVLGGCATMEDEEIPTRDDERFACSTARLGNLVGQQATQTLGAETVRASNARTLRWIRPGMAVTMDYRTDRLNIHLDNQNRITRVNCG